MLASAGAAAAVAAAESSTSALTTPSEVAEALNQRFLEGNWRRGSNVGVFVTVLERLWFESAPAQPWSRRAAGSPLMTRTVAVTMRMRTMRTFLNGCG